MEFKEVLKLCQKEIHKSIFLVREIDKRKALFLAIRGDCSYAYLLIINNGMPKILDQAEWI